MKGDDWRHEHVKMRLAQAFGVWVQIFYFAISDLLYILQI